MGKKHKKRGKLPKNASLIERTEIRLMEGLRDFLDHPAARAAGWIGDVGDQPPMRALGALTLAGGVVLKDRQAMRAGAGMIAAHLVATGAKSLVKRGVDRTRPRELLATGAYHSGPGSSAPDPALQSFPSGHTAGVVAVARAFGREFPAHRANAMAAATAVSALQIPRRAHYPSDILAGALIGFLAELVTEQVAKRLRTTAPAEA